MEKKTKSSFTRAEADIIIALIKEKLKSDSSSQKGIRAKIRKLGFWASEFGFRDGYSVADFLSVTKIIGSVTEPVGKQIPIAKPSIVHGKQIAVKPLSRSNSDENYIIDLCNEVLMKTALRQHRFDFLKGDAGTKLPVDAYYPDLNLVVEFREKQHTEAVAFFDRRQTVSGMGRCEQRKLYDQRRREVLPEHGIKLIELGYDDFMHTSGKRLVRDKHNDLNVIKEKLKAI